MFHRAISVRGAGGPRSLRGRETAIRVDALKIQRLNDCNGSTSPPLESSCPEAVVRITRRGACTRAGTGNHVRVVSCGDKGYITLCREDPRKHPLPGFAPAAVGVTIALNAPFKMSDRHVCRKRPNCKRQVAPRAV